MKRFLHRGLADPQRREFLFKVIPRNTVGAEIGVWEGDFSKLLLKRVRPTELHLVDPWMHVPDKRYSQAWYGGLINQPQMEAMYETVVAKFGGNPRVVIHRQTSLEAAMEFDDAHFDWIYIDGDHTYESARADLAAWVPKVKVGGIVICDDYIEGQWFDGGVKRAVDEYTADGGIPVEVRALQAIFEVAPREPRDRVA